ncbi:hypothetical protein ACLMJK_009187 [Lecanora helva]
MAPPPPRARSSTSGSTVSNRPRPVSRASTTSLNTPNPQPGQLQRHASENPHIPPRHGSHPPQLSNLSEGMVSKAGQRLISTNNSYAIDPSLQNSQSGPRAMSVDHSYDGHHGQMESGTDYPYPFESRESQIPTNFNDEPNQEDSGVGEFKKKKGSASSIANDQELRKLFRENHHRDLKEVAAEVLAHERGPRSEKTKQIFAMNWLNTVCKKSTSSVPRNRVFSHYATRCGTERVPPLNPASFGKLVRIIFPGILTRRLGQRGESKYHYVDLALVDEPLESQEDDQFRDAQGFGISEENTADRRPYLSGDTALFPSPEIPVNPNSTFGLAPKLEASSQLYLENATQRMHQDDLTSNMIRRQLKFPTRQESPYAHNEPIELPSLSDYLPENTDPDAADALIALYRTHCISVIDCFRFCKERMFWHHFSSFHGTLTVPVQKLLAHPKIAAWIKECDWLMYQKMIRFVSPLALQVMPVKVIETFRNISAKLVNHINYTFQNHPHHVRDAKTGPASIFAGLIDRLLRVNATAHAAANMLTNDANRDQMWHDWVCYVKAAGVVESTLPCCGYSSTLLILLLEIGELLGPLRSTSYPGMQQIFVNAQADPGPNYHPIVHSELDDSSTSGVLDRWTTFLHDLPNRFPGVDARALIWCAGEVSSACIRDITMAQALSFGSWWVTKVWVDEMLRWIAEKGGFLESKPYDIDMRPKKRTATAAGFGSYDHAESRGGSRPRTGVSDATDEPSNFDSPNLGNGVHHENGNTHPSTQLGTPHHIPKEEAENAENRLPQNSVKGAEMHQIATHDDSGIGMDFELPKGTPIRLADYGGFVTNNPNGNSDPADVVVC